MKIVLGMLLNLLESLDQIVNQEAQSAIGVLKDFFAKLNGKDGNTWWEMLKKFLRKEPCWASNTIQVVVDAIMAYIVDCTLSLQEMIKAGNYDWVNNDITVNRFPIQSTGADEWEFKVFHFGRSISSEDSVASIEADDSTNPWQSAGIEHLLTYGKNNPEEQLKYPIVALGSVGPVRGRRHVLFLGASGSGRYLSLDLWGGAWNAHYRFLAVRKLQKSVS